MNILDMPGPDLARAVHKIRDRVADYLDEGNPVAVFTTTDEFGHGLKLINEGDDGFTMPRVKRLFKLFSSNDVDGTALRVFPLSNETSVGSFQYVLTWDTWESCGSNALAEAILGFDQAYDLFGAAGAVCGPALFTNQKFETK
ncbi:hypothetical protein [Medusavirus stheno T3]|uniref:Uncharacterized protein n=1 Tax=Medusavirus stheno T3 TaxID=3069717 RepID=A0A7S7YG41_9VIRU|nr:hypothetical protein QKU73_gp245 [Acanthamoeba castellanii medusavirus]QPB44530.1 hypothetical protein [Medusavirus stheno T3]